jgi:hypothetical protein
LARVRRERELLDGHAEDRRRIRRGHLPRGRRWVARRGCIEAGRARILGSNSSHLTARRGRLRGRRYHALPEGRAHGNREACPSESRDQRHDPEGAERNQHARQQELTSLRDGSGRISVHLPR